MNTKEKSTSLICIRCNTQVRADHRTKKTTSWFQRNSETSSGCDSTGTCEACRLTSCAPRTKVLQDLKYQGTCVFLIIFLVHTFWVAHSTHMGKYNFTNTCSPRNRGDRRGGFSPSVPFTSVESNLAGNSQISGRVKWKIVFYKPTKLLCVS